MTLAWPISEELYSQYRGRERKAASSGGKLLAARQEECGYLELRICCSYPALLSLPSNCGH